MKLRLYYVLLPMVVASAFVLVAWFTAFSGSYDPPDKLTRGLGPLNLPTYPMRSVPVVLDTRGGVMAFDTLHFNHFFPGEMEALLSKVSDRGYDINFFGDLLALQLLNSAERVARLEEGLREADSLLIAPPILDYSEQEAQVVKRFVDKGGRVVLLGDPTRIQRVNQLATALGFIFEDDFLYNVVEHETNYRNVIFRDFAPHSVTSGLEQVVLYTSGSITGNAQPLMWGDSNTRSDAREAQLLSPMVLAADGQVVAVSDMTFIEPPYDRVLDNDRLLSNLADFLTTGERRFELEDFPFFFDATMAVSVTSPELLDLATSVSSFLTSGNRSATLEAFERPSVDTVFLGLYDDRESVNHHLQAGQVILSDGMVQAASSPPVPEATTGIILLDSRGGRYVLVAMAADEVQLSVVVQLLLSGGYRDNLVSPSVALFDFG